MKVFIVVHHNGGTHAYRASTIERVVLTVDGRTNIYFKDQVRGQEVTDKFNEVVEQLNA
jgi:hypothetical protein